ncbi:MAG TPA: hypothetical protein PK801_15745, partial [Aggregatilineales bacterium]|nr:hypothetical protein [Aggregatilineales bacterium]
APVIHFPVPWAASPESSFLKPPEEMRALITGAGFRERAWEDVTGTALAWFQRRPAPPGDGPPPLGLHLLLGEVFPQTFQNTVLSLEEGRISVIRAVFERR